MWSLFNEFGEFFVEEISANDGTEYGHGLGTHVRKVVDQNIFGDLNILGIHVREGFKMDLEEDERN